MDTQFIHLNNVVKLVHETSMVAVSCHRDVDITYGGLSQCYVAGFIDGVSKVEYARDKAPGVKTEYCGRWCHLHPDLEPEEFEEVEYAERVFRLRAVMRGFGPGDLEYDYPLFEQSRF